MMENLMHAKLMDFKKDDKQKINLFRSRNPNLN